MSGADKGKSGKVLHAYPALDRVLVEGVNMKKRHERSRRQGQKGQIIEKPMSINVSNVAIVDPKGGKASRVGITRTDGKRIRIAKKSGAVI